LHKTGVLKKNKKRRRPQAKNTVKTTIFRIAIYLLLGILIFPFVLLFAIKTGVIGELPDEQQLSDIRNF